MSTLVSNELFAQPGHRDDVTNLLPALRPGRYSRTPVTDPLPPDLRGALALIR
jgi:hypothetical protein